MDRVRWTPNQIWNIIMNESVYQMEPYATPQKGNWCCIHKQSLVWSLNRWCIWGQFTRGIIKGFLPIFLPHPKTKRDKHTQVYIHFYHKVCIFIKSMPQSLHLYGKYETYTTPQTKYTIKLIHLFIHSLENVFKQERNHTQQNRTEATESHYFRYPWDIKSSNSSP